MRIQGNLATYEFSDLLQWLAQGNKTGVLTVTGAGVEYRLGFDHGRIDMSASSDPAQRLDNFLHGKGVIDDATLARAERLRAATKMMSGQVLVTLGAINEMQLAHALREKTEEILCELLTWDQGTFEFEGGDRPDSSMVPISLEVTKLLLESMHRLDQQRGGQPVPPREPFPQAEPSDPVVPPEPVAPEEPGDSAAAAFQVAEPRPLPAPAEETQAIEGLALAEVLDPESPPEAQTDTGTVPLDEIPGDLPPHYAVMSQPPGPLRRLAPYMLLMVLSLGAATFYLANRDGTAQAAGVGPAGDPILFTQTMGPMPSPATDEALPAPEAAPQQPAPQAAPQPQAAVDADSPEAESLRRRYEEELAGLRRELEEARRQNRPTTAEPRAPQTPPSASDLPADAIMRAAVAPPTRPPATSEEQANPPSVATLRADAEAVPQPEPAASATRPSLPEAVAPDDAGEAVEPAQALVLVNPKLLTRPAPRYPAAARRHNRGASVTVRVLVGPDGEVQEVERVGGRAGMGFDRAAEDAARASTWVAGTRNGEPTAMWAELRFEFKP